MATNKDDYSDEFHPPPPWDFVPPGLDDDPAAREAALKKARQNRFLQVDKAASALAKAVLHRVDLIHHYQTKHPYKLYVQRTIDTDFHFDTIDDTVEIVPISLLYNRPKQAFLINNVVRPHARDNLFALFDNFITQIERMPRGCMKANLAMQVRVMRTAWQKWRSTKYDKMHSISASGFNAADIVNFAPETEITKVVTELNWTPEFTKAFFSAATVAHAGSYKCHT